MKRRNKSVKTQASDPSKGDGVITLLKQKLRSPTSEQIQKRAYEIHLARGGVPGRELDDWLQAERELKAEVSQLPEEDPAGLDKPLPPHG